MAKKSVVREAAVTYTEGDVFHALGLPDADDLLAKSKLAIAIHETIKNRKLTQAAASKIIGLVPSDVSKIVHGQLGEFTTEQLLHVLIRLGLDIDVVVHQTPKNADRVGTISVAYV